MLQILAKVFSWKKKPAVKPVAIRDVDDDIPRYPPFARGLPSASVDRVVNTQDELISRIRGTLRFNSDDFSQFVLPVISRYAAQVHLLPASETHHHRGAGGLFRHGLEVGFWAAQLADSKQFTVNGTPQDKRNNEPKWQLAAFLGGLLHDAGKPLSDLAVVDESGTRIWNPYSHSLIAWAHSEQIDRYFLRWRDKRHKRHEIFSLLNIDRILTEETRSYLSSSGPEILEAMLESIAGTSAEQTLTRIVLWADQQSVARDLKQHRLNVDEHAYGVPVERYVFDAMRRLIKSGRWKINEAGGKVWLFQEGVFVAWKHAVKDIAVLIQDDKIPGVPRDADTLADILIERGYALTFQDKQDKKEEAPGHRYWPIRPAVLEAKGGATLYALRLDSLDLLFTDEPPTVTKGYVGHAALAMKSKAGTGSEKTPQPNQALQPATEPLSQQAVVSELWEHELPPVDYADDEHGAGVFEDMALMPEPAPVQETSEGNTLQKESFESVVQTTVVTDLPGEEGAQYLRKAISLIEDGTHTLGQALYRLGNNRYAILYPEGARLFGQQTDVMKRLDADGLLEPDPVTLKKVQEHNGIKMLVLNEKSSQWVECKLRIIEQGEVLLPALKALQTQVAVKAKPSKPSQSTGSESKKEQTVQRKKTPAKRKARPKEVSLDKPMAEAPGIASEAKASGSNHSEGTSDNKFSVKVQIENIVKELKLQMMTGEGRWIVGPVEKGEEGIAVDIVTLDRILEEYPGITKRKLRSKFILSSTEWSLSSNKLMLKQP